MHTTTSLLTKNFLLIIAFFACSINPLFALDESKNTVHHTLIQNDDFSHLDKNGNPIGWSCKCQWQATKCDLKNDPSGGKILTIKPGCQLNSIRYSPLNQSEGIKFWVTVKAVPLHFQDLSLIAYANNVFGGYAALEQVHPNLISNIPNQVLLHSDALSSENKDNISVVINNNHNQDIEIKKIDALQEGNNPEPKSATLIEAIQESIIKTLPDSNLKDIWLPLPLDYASQVPLWMSVTPTPTNVIQTIRYMKDDIGNWGVIVKLNNHIPSGTEIHFRWDSIVLTRKISEEERSEVYRAESDPSQWLQTTAVVQSQYKPISTMAADLTKNDFDSIKKMSDISFWEQHNLGFPKDGQSNDAMTTFNKRSANCTGYANLTSAMGRAIGIATRSIANLEVDGSTMSTHYINEFYLEPYSGWIRFEPQAGTATPVLDDMYLIIHKDSINNESEQAFHQGPHITPATPYMSLFANLNDPTTNYTLLGDPNTFPDCPFAGCGARAGHYLDLRSSHDEMKKLFEIAHQNWQYDLNDYLMKGEINPKRQAIRDHASSIQNTDDLRKLLNELDELR